MAQKTVEIKGIGPVLLQRRKGTRSMRMSMRADGTVRVGMPTWMPYKSALAFIESQRAWLDKNRVQPRQMLLQPDIKIGKSHVLVFYESAEATRTTARLVGNEARVIHPVGMLYKDSSVQKAAERVAIKALTAEANALLPNRLTDLAKRYNFTYNSVTIKRLRTRWGSCSNHKDIILNCHLMQLPWELIDYVLLHELNHTNIMQHGAPFWDALAVYIPDLPRIRKAMRGYSPSLIMMNSEQK